MDKIPVFVPTSAQTPKHLADAFEVGWLGMGALQKSSKTGLRRISFVNKESRRHQYGNIRPAHWPDCRRVKPGDEVITPSFNYVADHQAITAAGAQVVMCDIKDDNLGIDCEKAEKLVTKKTKAIIPLHFAGIPCDIDKSVQVGQETQFEDWWKIVPCLWVND